MTKFVTSLGLCFLRDEAIDFVKSQFLSLKRTRNMQNGITTLRFFRHPTRLGSRPRLRASLRVASGWDERKWMLLIPHEIPALVCSFLSTGAALLSAVHGLMPAALFGMVRARIDVTDST